jgi:hypothetical protein
MIFSLFRFVENITQPPPTSSGDAFAVVVQGFAASLRRARFFAVAAAVETVMMRSLTECRPAFPCQAGIIRDASFIGLAASFGLSAVQRRPKICTEFTRVMIKFC